MQYYKMAEKQMRICHNCVKIYDAVVFTVMRNRATVEVVHDATDRARFHFTCYRGHEWTANFRAK